jgi:acetylcholinesterase
VFVGPRRYFLSFASKTQPTWAYIWKRGTNTPFLGAFHGSDLTTHFYPRSNVQYDDSKSNSILPRAWLWNLIPVLSAVDYLINFVDHLNPNPRPATTNPNLVFWPRYTPGNLNLLTFLDLPPLGSIIPLSLTLDNFRIAPMEFLTRLSLKYAV